MNNSSHQRPQWDDMEKAIRNARFQSAMELVGGGLIGITLLVGATAAAVSERAQNTLKNVQRSAPVSRRLSPVEKMADIDGFGRDLTEVQSPAPESQESVPAPKKSMREKMGMGGY